jgi:hypothetical protein
MKKTALLGIMLFVLLFITGCANTPTTSASSSSYQSSDFNPNKEARIRIFGQNGKPTIMQSGIDCEKGFHGDEINVGGTLGDAFGSLLALAKNLSLGMPQTQATLAISEQDGILSKAIYKEFAIPANKPVNIRSAFIGLTTTLETGAYRATYYEGDCTSDTISFIPQAGKDYEVISLYKNRACKAILVFEVNEINNLVQLTHIPTNEAVMCK